jgi:hypothetical protein
MTDQTEYSEKETKKRMEDALRRALMTPHKPHSEMKIKKESSRAKRAKRASRKAKELG